MLDNRLPTRPGKARYECVVYDATNTLLTVFRTDDLHSIPLIRSFAENYVVKHICASHTYCRIDFLDNNALVDSRIRGSYGSIGGRKIEGREVRGRYL